MFGTSGPKEFFRSVCNLADISKDGCYPELTIHEAYARLADWPEGQAKFRELTGYEPPPYTADAVQQFVDMWGPKIGSKPEERARHVPPTCKESLQVKKVERLRCYLGRDGKLRCYDGYEECLFIDNYEDVHLAQPEQLTIDDGHKRITVAEALGIVRDRPKQLAKLKEMAGIVDACYFCGDPATKQGPFPRCDYCEDSRQRSIDEGATDSIMYIAEADANRKHLARLMSTPCKEMRV